MKTLLLRLAAPMQAWGTQSRFTWRETNLEPSKSGVIGLLCAALGKPRIETEDDGFDSLEQLAALRMGVRVDQPGVLLRDYHTVGGTHLRDEDKFIFEFEKGKLKRKRNPGHYGVLQSNGDDRTTVVSHRFYLSDAKFLVGLEAATAEQERLLETLKRKLRTPAWQLCLGRKSFVPSEPVWLKRCAFDAKLEDVFKHYQWLGSDERLRFKSSQLRCVLETDPGDAEGVARMDVPECYEHGARRFTVRYVKTTEVKFPLEVLNEEEVNYDE